MAIGDEIREQRAKLKGQGPKAYLRYFWDYYKVHTAVVIVVVIGLISVIRSVAGQKETAFSVIMLNAGAYEETYYNAVYQGFAAYADIDTDKYELGVDLTESLAAGGGSQYDYATMQKIVVQEAAQQLDTLVANAYQFNRYAMGGTYADLRDVMTKEQLSKYEGRIFYVDAAAIRARDEKLEDGMTFEEEPSPEEAAAAEKVGTFVLPDPDKMEEPIPYGIVTTDAPFMKTSGIYGDTVNVWGCVANSTHKDLSVKFLEFLDNTSYEGIQ